MLKLRETNRIICVIVVAVLLLAVISCSKVTQENYEKIKVGMPYEEVKKILGDPTNCESGMGVKSCIWQSGEKTIELKLLADKIIFHSKTNF